MRKEEKCAILSIILIFRYDTFTVQRPTKKITPNLIFSPKLHSIRKTKRNPPKVVPRHPGSAGYRHYREDSDVLTKVPVLNDVVTGRPVVA